MARSRNNTTRNGGVDINFVVDVNEFNAILNKLQAAGEGKRINSVVTQAVRAGLAPIRTEARRQAPVRTGLLKKTIHTYIPKSKRWMKWIGGRVQTGTRAMMGIDKDAEAYYPASVEYGRAAPGDAGGVKVVAPNPFMRRAYEMAKGIAQKKFIERLRVGVDKIFARKAAKAA